MKIALGLDYHGAAYLGWQRQAPHGARDATTVQGQLEHALSCVADAPIEVTAAGRTDTGVHAALQIVHLETSVSRPLSAWVRGANTHLPHDVSVRWSAEVPDEFHARFSAVSRQYVYWLVDHAARPGLLAQRVGWFHLPLDAHAMHEAAQHLVGEHDFTSFRASECQSKSPVKMMHAIRVARVGDKIRIDVHANAFLHHMVRNIVGALVYVGAQKVPTPQMREWLLARNRAALPPTFSAAGLYLAGMEYPAQFALPEQFVDVNL
jgi:tRNA pseudouridine38-40 synthase